MRVASQVLRDGERPPSPRPILSGWCERAGSPSVPEPSLFPLPGPTSPASPAAGVLAHGCCCLEKVPKLLTQKEKKKRKKMLLICMLTYIYLHVRLPCAELSPVPWVVTFPAGRTPRCSPLPHIPEPTLPAHPGWRQTPSSGKGFSSLHDPDLH